MSTQTGNSNVFIFILFYFVLVFCQALEAIKLLREGEGFKIQRAQMRLKVSAPGKKFRFFSLLLCE
jgi:hypothetical protein